jgi:hypothetical protein
MANCAAFRGTAADIPSRIYLKCPFRSFRHRACRHVKVSCADRQHVPIGGEMPLSRELDGVAMSAVTATGMPRIRKNAAASGSQQGEDACYLMSAVDAWFIGTEFAEAPGTVTAQGEADPRNTIAWNRRDGSIRAAARRFFGYVQPRQRAEELRRTCTRCVRGPWHPRLCERAQCVTQQVRGLAVPGREPEAHVPGERQISGVSNIAIPRFADTVPCPDDGLPRISLTPIGPARPPEMS